MYNRTDSGLTEVVVLGYRYTPQGLMYELQPLEQRKNLISFHLFQGMRNSQEK